MNKSITIARIVSITSVVFFLFYPMNFFSLLYPNTETKILSLQDIAILFLFTYAWLAWVIMAVAWAFHQRLPRFWPISGCIAGTISFIFVFPLVLPAFLVLPAVLLAILFCKFHLQRTSTKP
jgi:hypothetical protein